MSPLQTCFQSPVSLRPAVTLMILAGLVLLLTATPLLGQPPTLSQRVLASEDPAAFRQEIDSYHEHFVGQLFSDNPAAVAGARKQLIDPLLKAEASASFKSYYTDALATRLQRSSTGAQTFNQLNAAIVTEKLALNTQNTRLAPLIRQFVEADSASVAIWGAKAAYPIFPDVVRNLAGRDRDAFIASLVAAVKRFPDNGPLAEEVYRTLSMRTMDANPPPAQVLEGGTAAVVPAVHDLIAFRVGQYAPSQPAPSPLAEGPGLVVLTNNFVWPAQSPEQKLRTVTVLRDLMLQATATANNLQPAVEERVAIVDMIRRIGSAYEAISSPAQAGAPPEHPELNRAANKLRNISTRSSPTILTQAVNEVRDGLGKAYPSLPEPQLSTRAGEEPEVPVAPQN